MNLEKEILEEISNYENRKLFVVDFSISLSKKINLLIDSIDGITIGDCTKISRKIRRRLEEKLDEYELNVSSPGIDQAFKMKEQYVKNIGREVVIILTTGEKRKGKLLNYTNNIIEIEETKIIKKKNSKKKEKIIETIEFDTKNIKSTKLVVKFK